MLILDDFGMRELTAAQADDLYELITERAGRSLILTSNRAPADWYPLFPNPVVAESLLDRLINTSHQVFMNGPSYRRTRDPRVVTPTGKEDIQVKQEQAQDLGNYVNAGLRNYVIVQHSRMVWPPTWWIS